MMFFYYTTLLTSEKMMLYNKGTKTIKRIEFIESVLNIGFWIEKRTILFKSFSRGIAVYGHD